MPLDRYPSLKGDRGRCRSRRRGTGYRPAPRCTTRFCAMSLKTY